ncbi:hypothetical protein ACQY0O_004558 [Thecaphora frezii]
MLQSASPPSDECLQMQQDEILALDSIYNQHPLHHPDPADAPHSVKPQPYLVVERNHAQQPPLLRLSLPVLLPCPTVIRVTSRWPAPKPKSPPMAPSAQPPATSHLQPSAATFYPQARPESGREGSGPSKLVENMAKLNMRETPSGSAAKASPPSPKERATDRGTPKEAARGRNRRRPARSRGGAAAGEPHVTPARHPTHVPHAPNQEQQQNHTNGKGKGKAVPRHRTDPTGSHPNAAPSKALQRQLMPKAAADGVQPPSVGPSHLEGSVQSECVSRSNGASATATGDDIGGIPTPTSTPTPAPRPAKTQRLPPLAHLPPVTLRVKLPPMYPLHAAPEILTIEAPWLSTSGADGGVSWIRRRLQEQYNDLGGSEVLWCWGQWLAEGMWEELLATTTTFSQTDATAAAPFRPSSDGSSSGSAPCCNLEFHEELASAEDAPLLPATLLAHSRLCTRTDFDATSFDCGICLENRKGHKCIRLSGCGHVFCCECVIAYLSLLVDEGFHRQAKRCPDPECVRMRGEMEKRGEDPERPQSTTDGDGDGGGAGDGTEAEANDQVEGKRGAVRGSITRHELDMILTPAQLARLDRLSLKARMEADPSITYCPRSGCEAAVVRKPGDEGIWERFRECGECGMSFCAWCRRSWHGTNACAATFHADVVERYRALAEGSWERDQMEMTFGKQQLVMLVQRWEEEEASRAWMKERTTPCPGCRVYVEKSFGCNHMTCQACRTHYCYLCGKSISATNPYGHFNTPGQACYNRLFDGMLPDTPRGNGEDEIDMADLIPWEEML